ncbi:MAG: Hcp family type VI secretion system effector [Solirubrobacteraceae bacterium]
MSAQEASRIATAVQRIRNSKRALQVGLPTAAALGAGAAIAMGSVVGSDGTITGCYANETGPKGEQKVVTISGVTEPPGALRVIDPAKTVPVGTPGPNVAGECQPGEATISWNQKGPQGPPGPAGPAGSQGAAGEPALPGETTFGFSNVSGNTFIKLDGIKGESTDSKHKGDIEISSFQWGVGRGVAATSGGAGAGKTMIQSFSITKVLDKSSPLLLSAAASGKHIKDAELLFSRKAGGKQQDYLYIKMSDVLISSVQDGTAPNGRTQEKVNFVFQKAQEVFVNGDGRPQAKVNLNFAASKAF